jgi:hypothetical protein
MSTFGVPRRADASSTPASSSARRSTPPASPARRPRPSTPPDAVRRPADAERKRAQQQLESVSVEVLLKQKARLQAELDKLERWRASVGSSFQVAWQEERAAHQRDLNEMTRELGAAQDRARRLQLELEQERSGRAAQHLAAKHAIARAQADTLWVGLGLGLALSRSRSRSRSLRLSRSRSLRLSRSRSRSLNLTSAGGRARGAQVARGAQAEWRRTAQGAAAAAHQVRVS